MKYIKINMLGITLNIFKRGNSVIFNLISFELSVHNYKYLFRSHEINTFCLNLVTYLIP